MKKRSVFLAFFLLSGISLFAQTVKISGKISDIEGNPVQGVNIFLEPYGKQTISGYTGGYSFTANPGTKQITARVLGYRSESVKFELRADTVIDFRLELSPVELSEVVITGDSSKNIMVTPRGSFIIAPVAIHEVPKQFSEPDLLKSIQMLPGVVSGKDGTSDIYVRGGGPGQNVVLANGCYFFLPGHLLGIVSPYDLDFLESAELYKDYFPAELGNGASSVIMITVRKNPASKVKKVIL